MSRRNIGKFSPGFWLLLSAGSVFHRLYYRKFVVKFRNKIPKNSPIIFAANHQNAFLDAVAIIFSTHKQIVFMARADIFKKKFIAALLYFIKILPVYRIRDGFHSVDQNKDVFKEVIDVLDNNRVTALFPEGSHFGEKRLRPFKKGAARLAMLAEETISERHDVYIVPVGIDYSNYYHAGSDLLVVFGDPISSAKYKELFKENPAQALNVLTDDLYIELDKVMLNISTNNNEKFGSEKDKHYRVVHDSVVLYCPEELKKQNLKDTLWNNFRTQKDLAARIIKNIPGKEMEIKDLEKHIHEYQKKLKINKIRDVQVKKPARNIGLLYLQFCFSFLLLPLHLFGMVMNYIPYGLPIYFGRNIKDPHFIGSVHFSAGLLLSIIYYPIIALISFFIIHNLLWWLLFSLSVPVAGMFTFYHYKYLRKLQADMRWAWIRLRKRALFNELMEKRSIIIDNIEKLV